MDFDRSNAQCDDEGNTKHTGFRRLKNNTGKIPLAFSLTVIVLVISFQIFYSLENADIRTKNSITFRKPIHLGNEKTTISQLPISDTALNSSKSTYTYSHCKSTSNLTLPSLQTVKEIDEFWTSSYLSITKGKNRNLPTAESLKAYVRFHIRYTSCIKATISDEKVCLEDLKLIRNVGIIIWECTTRLCGGVGDRMRGIRLAFLIAVATRRLFYIKWPQTNSAPFDLTIALYPAAIDWRIPDHLKTSKQTDLSLNFVENYKIFIKTEGVQSQSHDVEEFNFSKTDFQGLFRQHKIVRMTNRLPRSALLNLTSNNLYSNNTLYGLQKEFNDLPALERRLSRLLFRPAPAVMREVQNRIPKNNERFIGVHVRTGDDVGEASSDRMRTTVTDPEKIAYRVLLCVKQIHWYFTKTRRKYKHVRKKKRMDEMDDEVLHVFIASDSLEFKHSFLRASNTINQNLPSTNPSRNIQIKVYGDFEKVLHVDKSLHTYTSINDRKEEEICRAFINVFADIYALANSSGMVFLHSGYPITALSLSRVNRWKELDVKSPHNSNECVIANHKLP